ncbi:LysR family transcriptional regulator [Acidovorax carolinensis]|uniref:LysR family transcriptional regulator n=1 Tax=Acidovorax carolinensis TaxID=553814 RepID=A0A240UAU1_9BURK|nr:LysR family transcriptional regulator [Acidovorax carolinensis]ART55905.1 LysR family transcriptional regulator [Acidovorax carolinensis]ART58195.1 LysR family transcriptional regulator [Acidovorax carolinensis]
MDRLLTMRVFQAVVEEGGFAAAARSMELSPPVVTRLVADLEQHLGTRLLQRTTRKLALTDAGESYLLRVRAILHEIEDAEAAAAASTRDLRGTIRVLAAPLLATHFLAPMLASWHALYPKLMLDILVDPFPAMRVDEFDVTFMVAGDDYDGNIVARPMAHWEAVVIAAPGYLQRKGVPAEPGDLQNHEYLRYSGQLVRSQSGAARRLRLQPLHGAGAAQEVKVPVVLQSVSAGVLLRAAVDGMGVAVMSRLLAAPYLASGALVHVLPDWMFSRYTVYAALPSRRMMPARTKVFLDFVSERSPRLAYGHPVD